VSIVNKTFARKAIQLEVILLSPEMGQTSPTAISDSKIFPGRNPRIPLKRGKKIRKGKRERKGEGR